MSIDNEQKKQKIQACRELYLKYKGQHHELIEAEMRELGYTDFHRRCLYRRFERGRLRSGWIEQYGWPSLLKAANDANAGNAGALACTDAVAASGEASYASSLDDTERTPAGGTGGTGEGACAPGKRGVPGNRRFNRTVAENDFEDFQKWLKHVSPSMSWTWKHQIYIYKRLQRVTDGQCKRLMLFMPPRHGKSELVTVRYAAWRIKQDPKLNVIVGSYSQKLANTFSTKIRRVLADDAYLSVPPTAAAESGGNGRATVPGQTANNVQRGGGAGSRQPGPPADSAGAGGSDNLFPFTYRRPINTAAAWETRDGGGVRAVGVGSGVTGYGAGLIIVDDPVKSRAEADSETYRERVWNWFNDDLYTRLDPNGAIILIQTRWHEDDLAGRLLKEMAEDGGEHWDVVNLPALAEEAGNASALACTDAAAASGEAAYTPQPG